MRRLLKLNRWPRNLPSFLSLKQSLDYGLDFGRFLLDHFKVKALIDISTRVFPAPLIGTCVIQKRENNQTVFMYADIAETEAFKVDEILEAIEKPEKHEERYIVRSLKQGEISKDQKWINLLFDVDAILSKLRKRSLFSSALVLAPNSSTASRSP